MAVQVTVVIPIANKLPEGGEHVTLGEGSTLSVALTLYPTTAPSRPVALTVMSPGSDRTGAITSAALLNVAVTDRAPLIVTVQGFGAPAHAPLHPANVDPFAVFACSVTLSPLL